jgi:hypothetical protein
MTIWTAAKIARLTAMAGMARRRRSPMVTMRVKANAA